MALQLSSLVTQLTLNKSEHHSTSAAEELCKNYCPAEIQNVIIKRAVLKNV